MVKKKSKSKTEKMSLSKKIEKRISEGESKTLKQKFLKKPKAKGPVPISTKKTLKSFAHSTGPVVRQVERKEIVQDNRSQFFKEELAKEERGINKWLG